MKNPFLEAGRVVGTHGVRGELRVEPWCDSARFLTGFSEFYWDGGKEKVKVTSSRPHKNLLLLKLEGIDTVEQGDALRGRVLYLNRKDVKLPEGRFFVQDLIGLSAVDADDGRVYGKVTDVFPTGSNDVYQVTDEDGKNYLVPAIRDVVVRVDVDAGVMELRPMRGIFDDAD